VPYKVLTGLNYPPDHRAEVGSVVDNIPTKSLKWLLEEGHIELVDSVEKPVSKKGVK
tara:strand:- start:218 stop:388 length:171 start_codon:yes stop_codon:yes gene_type:complete